MISASALATALLLSTAAGGPAGPDACAPVAPVAPPDPAAAAAYREVADVERAAGSADTAAAAYRAAAARDPDDARSRAALAALCAEQEREDPFARGLRRMRAGDRAGAAAAFEEARARGGADPSSALLEGICRYELGEDARARPLLEEAAREPVHRDAARFFLGLLALRAGRAQEAAALLDASAADRGFGPAAADLARVARRGGRVVLSLLVDAGWDSNLDLTPDGAGHGEQDASAGATALVRVAPWGDTGPFLRTSGTFRQQARHGAFDLAAGSVAAGWQAGRAGRYVLAEGGWDYRAVGGDAYLSAPRALATARQTLGGGGVSAGLTYAVRREQYLAAGLDGYSGVRQSAEADVTLGLRRRGALVLAWRGGYDDARDPTLVWWEQGPRAALRLVLGRDTRLLLEAGHAWRTYTRLDPELGARRRDRVVDGAAVLERELGDRWTLRAAVAVEHADSSVAAFTYTRVVPSLGLAYTTGLL